MNLNFILFLPVLLFSIVLHEVAHGWVALRQGDDTAERLGRITLNPLPHVDLFGTILFPLLLWASQAGFLFGWAKPVPVDPRKFRDYRRGDILVSLAGVTANLLLCVAFLVLILVVGLIHQVVPGATPTVELLVRMAQYGVLINLVLAFFNLVPIPPLDGSHVVYHLLPPKMGAAYRRVGRFGILLLIGVMFFAPNLLGVVFWPVNVVSRLMEPLVSWAT